MAVDFVFVQSTGYDFESGPCGTGDGGREDIWGTEIRAWPPRLTWSFT